MRPRITADERASGPSGAAPVVIIGAGPAGLTAGLRLAEAGVPVVVVEAGTRVGGLAKTIEYKGYRFDIGGHRFFTRDDEVRDLWHRMLGDDLLVRPRLSRIYFDGKFFDYPLKPAALFALGVFRSLAILASYVRARLRPIAPERSFEDWVTNRFGRRLFRLFFKTYTEKVWGIPCDQISARWAAQRIRGLSLKTALLDVLTSRWRREGGRQIRTLIGEFEYPRLGPGMMWEAFADRIEQLGGVILRDARVTALTHEKGVITGVEIEHRAGRQVLTAQHVVSTMPLPHLAAALGDDVPEVVRQAARGLAHRDFILVAVIVERAEVFPDNWIYVHDPAVKVGRIQNFKNWSRDMVPDPSMTCLGLEYFCSVGDPIWSLPDGELTQLAVQELAAIGLVAPVTVQDATVVRVRDAYPVYDEGYDARLRTVREYLTTFGNLQTVGRNGTHTYNNQDHSMVMGMLAARNVLGERHDVWAADGGHEYFEAGPPPSGAAGGPPRARPAPRPFPVVIGRADALERR